MMRIATVAFIMTSLLCAHALCAQQAVVPETTLRLRFHHVVIDMTDSAAEVTEMLIFLNADSLPYVASSEHDEIEIPLAEGFSNLRLGGDSSDWRVNDSHDKLSYVAPLASGMTRLLLTYDLAPENGVVEFVEETTCDTDKYLFVTSNPGISLESDILLHGESISSGEKEVRGLSAENLPAGTTVMVVARLSAPVQSRSPAGLLVTIASLLVLSAVIYATARKARGACTSDERLIQLEQRKERIEKSLDEPGTGEKRAHQERLAATDRLINLIVDIRKRATRSP